jgi:hypothetical protein
MHSNRFVEIRTASLLPEWSVSDSQVRQKAQNYRKNLLETYEKIKYLSMIESVYEEYIQHDIKQAMKNQNDFREIDKLFREAIDKNDVKKVIRAYTLSGSFFKILNHHLAIILSADNVERIKMRKTVKMHYWEGSLDIATMLVCHPDLEDCRFRQGTVFRGMRIDKDEDLLPYRKVGTRLLNKTFISTSKNPETAMIFSGANPDSPSSTKGCLFKYTIIESTRQTALDIHRFSNFPEEEVLILPYATFEVMNIQHENLIEIELKECEPECDFGQQNYLL